MKMFAVYDSKAETFLNPFFMQSRGLAIRAFNTTAQDQRTEIAKYPGDFTLFELGDWSEVTGQLDPYPVQENLGTALTTLAMSQPKIPSHIHAVLDSNSANA